MTTKQAPSCFGFTSRWISELLLMEEIGHHLGCKKNLYVNNGIKTINLNWWSPDFWTIHSINSISVLTCSWDEENHRLSVWFGQGYFWKPPWRAKIKARLYFDGFVTWWCCLYFLNLLHPKTRKMSHEPFVTMSDRFFFSSIFYGPSRGQKSNGCPAKPQNEETPSPATPSSP